MTVLSDQENSVMSGTGNSSTTNGHHPHPNFPGSSVGRAAASHLMADTQSNAYATINKLPGSGGSAMGASRRGFDGRSGSPPPPPPDYATLEKHVSRMPRSPPGPVVPGIHPPPPPAYQSSTLPGRGSTNGVNGALSAARGPRGSALVINRNGEPELVADLM